MDQNQKSKWEKIRARGKSRYVLINGILWRGIPVAVMAFIFALGYDYFSDDDAFSRSPFNPAVKLFINLVVFSGVGCLISHFEWDKIEREFADKK